MAKKSAKKNASCKLSVKSTFKKLMFFQKNRLFGK